ncbi:MAG: hypothetical protein K2P42_10125 [Lachnospiraceae bacterium]|nr:hypothetical protein [Lachnospiraceae bacterium]
MKKQLIPILILSGALLYGCADHLSEKEIVTLPAPGSSSEEQSDAAPQADPSAAITETEVDPASIVNTDTANTDTANVFTANTDTANTDAANTDAANADAEDADTANAGTEGVPDIPQSVVSQPEDGTIADSGFYRVATSISSVEVERYAAQVRQQFLAHDWTAVASKIAYPVAISGVTYSSSAAFLEASENFDGNLDDAFFSALEAEDCVEMFCNYQGIMLGETGQVWIGEVLDESLVSQGLKIIAVNGLTK